MVSIIIVHYKVKNELMACISSIFNSKTKLKFEILVVDNDERDSIGKELKTKFPKVKYIKSLRNIGFGAGNNLGAQYARGEYLFFLNPDTKVTDGALDNLQDFFVKNNNVGIISPVIVDNQLIPFKSQGSKELTPKTILFSQSFLRKIFPAKNIYNKNILENWNMRDPIIIDTVPGAAMMINANIFKKIGGFDNKLFLYFEENDISERLTKLGYKLYIVPSAKIIHLVGRSTEKLKEVENIYSKSRYYYLKKHYGVLKATLSNIILSINKFTIPVFLAMILAYILRIINIDKSMPFIGDHGWFYLSARDMLNGQIPLVGIASSHPWLHQGPLWTYMLACIFRVFGFNPLNGAYLAISLEIFSVLMVYVAGSEMFSKRVGIISAFLYAASPLVVLYSRTPYHTSPIPLFSLFYIFSLYKFIKGNNCYFPLSIFFLAILYNFELATAILWFLLLAILVYGIWKKTTWIKQLLNKKIISFSVLGLLIPMLPILIYDFSHKFPQTLGFIVWIGYRILKLFGFPSIHGEVQVAGSGAMFNFFFHYYQKLIFAPNQIIAFAILVFSIAVMIVGILNANRKNTLNTGFNLLFLWLIISLGGYFANQTSSGAYLPIFFPAIIMLTAYSFDAVMSIKGFIIPTILLIVFILFGNSYNVISSEYSTREYGYSNRLSIAKEIIKNANGRNYNIIGTGDGSKFESFTMNYEYLTWWLGHPPSKSNQKLKYIIRENKNGIMLINK
jgi:GT2 family glycosyltransferase